MTISTILGERATSHPDRVFLRFAEGDLTFAATDAAVDGVACGLHAHGVRPGEPVAVLMPNCIDFVVTWFALSRLGAVSAPINTAFRGSVLVHILNLSKASVVVVDESLIGVLVAIAAELGFVTTVVVRGDAAAVAGRLPRWRVLAFTELAAAHGQVVRHVSADSDLALVLFTSGTTGRSKGCMLSHRYVVRQAELMIENLRLVDDDVLFCPFPLFHLDASVLTVVPALVLGTTAAISTRFSAAQFWPEVRASGATVFDFMGATLSILHNQPAASGDASNPVRLGWGVPLPEFTPEFEQRFGLRLVELYGSTDVGVPIYTPLDEPRRLGSCGRTIPAYETRLVDADDRDVPTGAVGEIVVRPREPSLIMDGYLGMPEETLRTTRNLWFHTGDLARQDGDSYIYFVGRRKDAIRRRGENISAFEVEEIVEQHPLVVEAAAFGVPSALTEEDVMVAIVLAPGARLEPSALWQFCAQRMAKYMVPRYVDVVASLPKTPTEKVEKWVLAERGVTATAWDAEAGR